MYTDLDRTFYVVVALLVSLKKYQMLIHIPQD